MKANSQFLLVDSDMNGKSTLVKVKNFALLTNHNGELLFYSLVQSSRMETPFYNADKYLLILRNFARLRNFQRNGNE